MREKITVSPQARYPVMHAFQVKFEKKYFCRKNAYARGIFNIFK